MVLSADAARHHEAPVAPLRRARRWFWHRVIRAFMLLHTTALAVATAVGRRSTPKPSGKRLRILLTGRFDSDNWAMSHLGPLASSAACSCVWMVSTNPVPAMEKVCGFYPPRWLVRTAGVTAARLLVFLWIAIRMRPDIVGGFHLLLNGLAATVVARLVGARSLYFCVGGPVEVLGGGFSTESRLFEHLETPDPVVERRLLRAVADFDLVITMGKRAVQFFREKGVKTSFHVVSGGIDCKEFQPARDALPLDLILVGRVVEIKRIDLFLQVVAQAVKQIPTLSAAVVGDGELRVPLERLARDLGLDGHVTFAGHQRDVASWLRRAKVFVLTSRSEGLSLALIEAMMCGLPAVVCKVGDLDELVEDGVNGYLIASRTAEDFTSRIVELLTDRGKYAAFSRAAQESARCYEVSATTRKWDEILSAGVSV